MSEPLHDPIHNRGQQLENLFFQKRDAELLDRLRQKREHEEMREQLRAASGIQDGKAVDGLVDVGVTAASLTSVALIPLVAVAWADRKMEYAEKVAVLEAAETVGLEKGSASYELVSSWLETPPPEELLDAWKSYIAAIKERADADAVALMKETVMERAEKIATAAGGLLGMGSKISVSEQKMLDELSAAF